MDAIEHRMTANVLPWTSAASYRRLLPRNERLAEAIWIAFVVVQALDGALTFVGIQTFGTDIEANPLLAWYVSALGPAPALVAAKLFAVACGMALYVTARHRTLAVLALTYLVAAVGPWMHIFWRTDW
jgi:uncharacterized membrane protein